MSAPTGPHTPSTDRHAVPATEAFRPRHPDAQYPDPDAPYAGSSYAGRVARPGPSADDRATAIHRPAGVPAPPQHGAAAIKSPRTVRASIAAVIGVVAFLLGAGLSMLIGPIGGGPGGPGGAGAPGGTGDTSTTQQQSGTAQSGTATTGTSRSGTSSTGT